MTLPLIGYCTICDNAEPCEHAGARRYLDPIDYQHLVDEHGKTVGYRVRDEDRERWNNPVKGTPPSSVVELIRPIQELVIELEQWCDINGTIEPLLRSLYEQEPAKITRLAQHVIDASKAGQLRSPGGLLMTKLRQLSKP